MTKLSKLVPAISMPQDLYFPIKKETVFSSLLNLTEMKKQVTAICISSLLAASLISSCTKKGSSTPSGPSENVDSFSITFDGITRTMLSPAQGAGYPAIGVSSVLTSQYGPSRCYATNIHAEDKHLICNFAASKLDTTSGVGIYTNAVGTITDHDNAVKIYSVDRNDSTINTITMSVSNATNIIGTFTLSLVYNGTHYPATGRFHYYSQ